MLVLAPRPGEPSSHGPQGLQAPAGEDSRPLLPLNAMGLTGPVALSHGDLWGLTSPNPGASWD